LYNNLKSCRTRRIYIPQVLQDHHLFSIYSLITTIRITLLLQLPDMFVSPEPEAYSDSCKCNDEEQQCCAGSFSASENPDQDTSLLPGCHQWFKDTVHEKSSQEISDRDRKKLKGIPYRVHSSLHFHRNPASQDDVQIR